MCLSPPSLTIIRPAHTDAPGLNHGHISSPHLALTSVRCPGARCTVCRPLRVVVVANLYRIWAYTITLTDPQQYYADQSPQALVSSHVFTPNSLSLTLQLGNVFLLLAALAVVCCFTTHGDIAKRYLIVVALADLGHIYSVYGALGEKIFWDLNQWNQMVASNVGVSVFLNINRLLTVAGLFGKVGASSNTSKKNI